MTLQTPLTQDHATLFLRLLERASIQTLLPMLDARKRWLLVIEILLGHAPVRGGRSRDYPFSADRMDSTKIAYQLVCCEDSFRPGRSAVSGHFSMYDFVVALQCIDACFELSARSEQHYTMAMRVLVEMLFPPDAAQHVLDSLGISDKGEDGAVSKCDAYRRREISMARRLAVFARTEIPPAEATEPIAFLCQRFDLRERELAELKGTTFNLIYLKTKEAQNFIDRCFTPFIQRGASFWCSQTSARARDMLTSGVLDARGIFLDNDAVTVLSARRGEQIADLEACIRTLWFDAEDPRQVATAFISRNYPRLLPYYRAAIESGLATSVAMPAFGVQVRTKSLLDLVTDSMAPGSTAASNDGEASVVIRATDHVNGSEDLPCSGRRGDTRISPADLAIPSWYNGRNGEGYGFPSIAFSLAELTYAKAGGRAIADQIKIRDGITLRSAATQLELLELTHSSDRRLTYLKYDGDGFGAKFTGVATLRRPGLSITMETLMRDTWLSALVALVRQYAFDVIPVDMVYFGGDDILATLPAYLLAPFLQAFDDALGTHGRLSRGSSFTFAAVTFELPSLAYSDQNLGANLHTHTIGEVNQLLTQAKKIAKSGEAGSLDSEYLHFGKQCEWSSFHQTQGLSLAPPRTR